MQEQSLSAEVCVPCLRSGKCHGHMANLPWFLPCPSLIRPAGILASLLAFHHGQTQLIWICLGTDVCPCGQALGCVLVAVAQTGEHKAADLIFASVCFVHCAVPGPGDCVAVNLWEYQDPHKYRGAGGSVTRSSGPHWKHQSNICWGKPNPQTQVKLDVMDGGLCAERFALLPLSS